MPELEAPRGRRGSHQRSGQQPVERVEHVPLRHLLDDLDVEGVAHDRRALQDHPLEGLQLGQLGHQRVPHRGRHRQAVVGAGRSGGGAVELLEVEGVAAAQVVDAVQPHCGVQPAEQPRRILLAQGAELEPLRPTLAQQRAQRRAEPRRDLSRTGGHGNEHRSLRQPAQQAGERLDGRRVGPLDVVQHEQAPGAPRERLEHRAHGLVDQVPLPGSQRRRLLAEQAGDDCGETALLTRIQRRDQVAPLGQHRVQRLRQGGERHVTRPLVGPGFDQAEPPLCGAVRQLAQQPALADARLALDQHAGGFSGGNPVEQLLDPGQLRVAAGQRGHAPDPRRSRRSEGVT